MQLCTPVLGGFKAMLAGLAMGALVGVGAEVGKGHVMQGGSDISPRKRNKDDFNAFREKNDGKLHSLYLIKCVLGMILLQPMMDGRGCPEGLPAQPQIRGSARKAPRRHHLLVTAQSSPWYHQRLVMAQGSPHSPGDLHPAAHWLGYLWFSGYFCCCLQNKHRVVKMLPLHPLLQTIGITVIPLGELWSTCYVC